MYICTIFGVLHKKCTTGEIIQQSTPKMSRLYHFDDESNIVPRHTIDFCLKIVVGCCMLGMGGRRGNEDQISYTVTSTPKVEVVKNRFTTPTIVCYRIGVECWITSKSTLTKSSPQWRSSRSTVTHIVLDLLLLIWGFGESCTIVRCITSQPANVS